MLQLENLKSKVQDSTNFVENHFKDLAHKFDFNFFVYIKIYNDGRIERYCNHLDWSKVYYTRRLFNESGFYKKHIENLPPDTEQFFLWETLKNESIYKEFFRENIWHGLSSYKKCDDHIESYSFAADPVNSDVYAVYFNHLEELKNYVIDFKKALSRYDSKSPYIITSKLRPTDYM